MEIGSIYYDTQSKKVVGFVESKDPMVTLSPDIISMSIDPHAEKYYSISPYAFVMNNPMRFIDPDGRDVWEMDHRGNVKWIEESEKHTMYALNTDGERTGASITISDRSIFDQLTLERTPSDYEGNYALTNSSEVGDVYLFAANNSEVEWGLQGYQGKNSRQYVLRTSHEDGRTQTIDNSKHGLTMENMFYELHSHPDPNGTKGGSGYGYMYGGDKQYVIDFHNKAEAQGISPAPHYVYHKYSKTLYQYTPTTSNIYIKKVNSVSDFRFLVPKR